MKRDHAQILSNASDRRRHPLRRHSLRRRAWIPLAPCLAPLRRRTLFFTMNLPRILLGIACILVAQPACAVNPLRAIGETFADWKERLFSSQADRPDVVDAPAQGPITLQAGHPQRFGILADAPERDFANGRSHYRIVELPQEVRHAALRVQVVAQSNDEGRGRTVFKPLLYALDDDDKAREPVEVKPLHLDIRPFRRTRLLGCTTLDNVRRFAVATAPEVVGKAYQSEVRKAVKAPTKGGFYYSTDAVKLRLPYAATGVLILEVTAEKASGEGC
jgi:hypothetical protein